MACGCPVIVARGTACEEIAGTAAIAIDPQDVAAMAEAVRAFLTNKDVAARYSRGRARPGRIIQLAQDGRGNSCGLPQSAGRT